MRTLFLVAYGFVVIASSALAGVQLKPIFEIRSKELILVGSDWRSDCPKRIKVTLRVDSDTPANNISIKALFFDSSNSKVAVYDSPSQVWKNTPKGFSGVALPKILPKNRDVEVFFPITPEMEKLWKSVIIVCSDSTESVARSRPLTAVEEIDFPNKDTTRLIRN